MTGEISSIESNHQTTTKSPQIEKYDNTEEMVRLVAEHEETFRKIELNDEEYFVVFDNNWLYYPFTGLTKEQEETLENLKKIGKLIITKDYFISIGEEEYPTPDNSHSPLELDFESVSAILNAVDEVCIYSKKGERHGRIAVDIGGNNVVFPFYRLVGFLQTPSNSLDLFQEDLKKIDDFFEIYKQQTNENNNPNSL
jgi:hypothetical protein